MSLMDKAIIHASGMVLVEYLPRDFRVMSYYDIHKFLEDNVSEEYEDYSGRDLWDKVRELAKELYDFCIKNNLHKTQPTQV